MIRTIVFHTKGGRLFEFETDEDEAYMFGTKLQYKQKHYEVTGYAYTKAGNFFLFVKEVEKNEV